MQKPMIKCAQCVHNKNGVCEIDDSEIARPDEMSCTRASTGKKPTRALLDSFWDGDDSGLTDEW